MENRLYALKGTGNKIGAIINTENQIKRLQDELKEGPKRAKAKQIEGRIEKLAKALDSMKEELPDIEIKLTQIRSQREPVKRGRPAGLFGGLFGSLSPAKV